MPALSAPPKIRTALTFTRPTASLALISGQIFSPQSLGSISTATTTLSLVLTTNRALPNRDLPNHSGGWSNPPLRPLWTIIPISISMSSRAIEAGVMFFPAASIISSTRNGSGIFVWALSSEHNRTATLPHHISAPILTTTSIGPLERPQRLPGLLIWEPSPPDNRT